MVIQVIQVKFGVGIKRDYKVIEKEVVQVPKNRKLYNCTQ